MSTRSFGPTPPNHTFRVPTIVAADLEVSLKWFDPARGFGFVRLGDDGPDALLPGAVVQAAGHDALPDGTTLRVDLTEGRRGKQVVAIHSVDTSTATPARPRPDRRPAERSSAPGGRRDFAGTPRRPAGGPASEMTGTVKWFNQTKGFGFIAPDDGGRDVFVHIKALERSGLSGLNENQRVRMSVRQGEKGMEAVSVSEA